jgi:hypothetical protein
MAFSRGYLWLFPSVNRFGGDLGLCRISVEISSETDRRKALWEWEAGWGNRPESGAKVGVQKEKKPKAFARVGAGIGPSELVANVYVFSDIFKLRETQVNNFTL